MDEGLDLWEASEQILWYLSLATETFVFYIQFFQNSKQYTTNNFPNNLSGVQFQAQADSCIQTLLQPSLKLTQFPIQKLIVALTPTANFLKSQYWGWESVKS